MNLGPQEALRPRKQRKKASKRNTSNEAWLRRFGKPWGVTLAGLAECLQYEFQPSPPSARPCPCPHMDAEGRSFYLGFISTLELMSSASRSYSSTWPLVHTFTRSVRSLLRGARMKS